jgi:hypothetical protein
VGTGCKGTGNEHEGIGNKREGMGNECEGVGNKHEGAGKGAKEGRHTISRVGATIANYQVSQAN